MPSVSNLAAQTLQRQILSSHYPAGSALPPQRELSENLGISRASLREAITMLEALGMVRSRPGKGVFVTAGTQPAADDLPSGPRGGLSSGPGSGSSHLSPAAIYQLRYVIEPANASLAAQRSSEAERHALAANLAAMEAALTASDLVTASEEDLQFHRLIARLSGHAGLQTIVEQFKVQLAFSLRLPFADRSHIWQTADEHRAIVDAIQSGNAEQARHAMQQHLLAAARRVGISFTPP